jgi:hypothetical protein
VTLAESARLAGVFCWAESRLFEVLGGWVATTGPHDAKLMFDRHSRHHAWRADQWRDRLPVLADLDPDSLIGPESPRLEASYRALADLDGTVARLAGAYRFALPRLAGSYRSYGAGANPVSDSSGLRTVAIVSRDVHQDWRDGEALLQTLIEDDASVTGASETVAALERVALGVELDCDDEAS